MNNKKNVSNTPAPPGAAGIIKPIDQDIQKIIKIKEILIWLISKKILRQKTKAKNFEPIKKTSIKKALNGKNDSHLILE